MKDRIVSYLETWWTVIARPIFFYTVMPAGSWQEDALTFASITSWVISFFLTVSIFVIQYVPIGLYMLKGDSPTQILITSPVTLFLSFTFFTMTMLIVGGVLLALVLGFLYVLGTVLHFTLKILGGKADLNDIIKASFYSSAVFLFGLVPVCFLIPAKYHVVEFWQVQALFDITYFVASIYIYGLWSIAARRVHDLPKWKSVLAASVPFVVLIFIGIVFHYKIFPKIGSYLG